MTDHGHDGSEPMTPTQGRARRAAYWVIQRTRLLLLGA